MAKGRSQKLTILVACCAIVAAGVVVALIWHRAASSTSQAAEPSSALSCDDESSAQASSSAAVDKTATLATPLIAEYGDVLIHCPVSTADLTEIAFHQSETPWALVMTTQLPEADIEAAANHAGTNRSATQPTGDVYLNGSALHLWRDAASTDMDTSIDCGAAAGSTIVAPVSGTVVNIREYTLEETIDDYEIHIQPSGHPELDMVIIHATDVCVDKGDEVVGGVTRIACVRDIASALSGIQLEDYTPAQTGGNHTHIQLNDANYAGYREARLEGAYVPDE